MYNKRKTIIVLGVSILCLILVLCITVPFLARNMYVHTLFTSAKPIESYDGNFAFLHLPSSKWYVRTVNIYDTGRAIGTQQVQTFEHSYNKYNVKEIMWGIKTNDLFFYTNETIYVYKYDEKWKQWIGPLHFSTTRTKKLRSQGIDDVYAFSPPDKMVGPDFLPIPAEFCQIPKQTIPVHFVKQMELYLNLN